MTSPIRFFDVPSIADEDTKFLIIGVPFDGEMTQSRGSCITAPDAIRAISLDLSLTSEDGTDLNSLHIADLGNISSVTKITKEVGKKFDQASQTVPIFLGGSHYISYYCFQSLSQAKSLENLYYISLDAHLDCFDEWNGNKYTHCTVTRRIFEQLGSKSENVHVIGARDIDLPELEWADQVRLRFSRIQDIFDSSGTKIVKLKEIFTNKNELKPPVYLSVDIDVFDPSVAPGTGYPIPGGITYRNYLHILDQIISHFDIVGVDFVEYSTTLDFPNNMTAILVAKLVIETLVRIKNKK